MTHDMMIGYVVQSVVGKCPRFKSLLLQIQKQKNSLTIDLC